MILNPDGHVPTHLPFCAALLGIPRSKLVLPLEAASATECLACHGIFSARLVAPYATASRAKQLGGPTTQKQRKVAASVHEALLRTFASGIIKDHGFEHGAAVHVVEVHVAPGALLARVLWEPMNDQHDWQRVERALQRKRGILRAHVNSYVCQKNAIQLEFLPALQYRSKVEDVLVAVRADVKAADERRTASKSD